MVLNTDRPRQVLNVLRDHALGFGHIEKVPSLSEFADTFDHLFHCLSEVGADYGR
jgi:hypothetical protein